MPKNNVYSGFSQALFFSGCASIPRFLLDHYSELGISDREMMLIIHLLNETDDPEHDLDEQIVIKMGISPQDYKLLIHSLIEKGFIDVRKQKNQKVNQPAKTPKYDISGLVDQLFELWGIDQYRRLEANGRNKLRPTSMDDPSLSKLIVVFEKELGRPLTGFECEHIEKWLNSNHTEELVIEALRRGVSAGIRNFRYLDSILREWEKKGLKTRLEVEAEDQNFQARTARKTDRQTKLKAPNKNKYDDLYL